MRFDELVGTRAPGQKLKAPRLLEVKAEEFASGYGKRPKSGIALGLRLLSAADVDTARAEAAKLALELHPGDDEARLECFNDTLIAWAVACGICDPNDVKATHPAFPMPQDQVRLAFPPVTLRRIFDEIERLQVDTSPIYGEATDDDLHTLSLVLSSDCPLAGLERAEQLRIRRYAKFILDGMGYEPEV